MPKLSLLVYPQLENNTILHQVKVTNGSGSIHLKNVHIQPPLLFRFSITLTQHLLQAFQPFNRQE